MSGLKDHGFIALGKYSRARDSILHFMGGSEWSTDWFGDLEFGAVYWRFNNTAEEVSRANSEFNSLLEDWLEYNPEVIDSDSLRSELVGEFVVFEDRDGFVHVEAFKTPGDCGEYWRTMTGRYNRWIGND